MNKLLLKSLLLLAGLCTSISLNAQTKKQALSNDKACKVVDIGLGENLPWETNSLRSFQIGWNSANGEDLIYKGEGIYVFRFAACITNAEFRSRFQNDKELVYRFWRNLEEYMNSIYERDCGIRFEVIRDDKLIFSEKEHDLLSGPNGHSGSYEKATRIITEAIGVESYDVGALIIPSGPNDPYDGLAIRRGVLSDKTKAAARVVSNPQTIAHEVGHLFGSIHTHVINPNGSMFTEPGKGQSVMSYGSPVNFFSLPSIQDIRKTLKSLPYYTDQKRTNKVAKNNLELSSAPYLDKSNIDRPELLRNEIKEEYRVTPGTFYQFSIPVKEKKEGYLYFAHSFDITTAGQTPHNIQRCYEPSSNNLIMFHPRNRRASEITTNRDGEIDDILPGSNDYKQGGVYTYMLSAYHKGQHDVKTIKLRIVPGNKFEIKKVTGIHQTLNRANYGDPLSIDWEPCTEIYGRDSKVRILLSDDFGQSFKYVLADNLPNNGRWSGHTPYVNIGAVNMLEVNGVRGGVLKVEVIGEAAYALSHIEAIGTQGKRFFGKGGFTTDNSKSINFNPMPPVYMEVENDSQVPEATDLTATSGGSTKTIKVAERRDGNLIYRSWTANIGSKTSVYTQLIKVLTSSNNDNGVLKSKILSIQDRAKELYNSIGTIGYPYGQLEKSKTFISAYEKVFEGDNNIKNSVTQSDYDELISAIVSLSNIEEWEFVKPITGHSYKIASYSYSLDDKRYHYFKSVNSGEETNKSESEASTWKLKEQDGIYKFSHNGHDLVLDGIANYDGGILLQKGDTWGSFMAVARNSSGAFYYVRANKSDGQLNKFSFASLNELSDYRSNVKAVSISTDFVFKPVANSYKVYLEKGNWTNAKALLKQNGNKIELTGKTASNNLFEFEIPAEYFLASIEFVNVANNSKTPLNYLGGVSAVYNQAAKRVYDLTINNAYATLYLDYPVSIPQGVNAYIAKAKANQNNKDFGLELYKLAGTIPAKTAVIIHTASTGTRATSTKTIRFEETNPVAPQESNILVGSIDNVETNDQNGNYLYFDLSNPSSSNDAYTFTPISKSKMIEKNKAYLRLYAYKGNIEKVVLPYDQFGNIPPPTPAPEKATITIPSTDGGIISLADGVDASSVEVGKTVRLIISPKAGYKLISIKVNGNDITNSKEFTVQSGNNNIEVVWQEVARIILPTAEGGTISLPNNINANEVAVGTKVLINVKAKEGYKLVSIKANNTDITDNKEFTVVSGENRIEVVWQKTTSIDITKGTDELKVYPNPTKDFVILSDANIGTKYKIYTINGVLIKEGEVQSNKHYISLSALSSGIYIIIIDNKSIKIEKL